MKINDGLSKYLENLNAAKVTERLLAKDITGAASITNEPNSLFYTSFSEEDAEAFYNIFEQYKSYSKENPFTAPSALKNNLDMQCASMDKKGICPVEILLFSARLINNDLEFNDTVHQYIEQIVEEYIKINQKSVFYILSGWEWEYILQIVLEACGKTNKDDLIRIAIDLMPDLVKKYTSLSDIIIVKGYLKMLSNSQNMDYLSVYGDLFSHPSICPPSVSDPSGTVNTLAKDELTNMLLHDTFMSEHATQIIEEICSRNIPIVLRNKLRGLSSYSGGYKKDLLQTLNSNIAISLKQQIIEETDLDDNVLYSFENCKDHRIGIDICKKICKDFGTIQYKMKSKAYIILGTKGGQTPECADIVIPFLKKEITGDDRYAVPISVAFAEYGLVPYPEIFKAMAKDQDANLWSAAVGQYLRFRRSVIERELFDYVDQTRRSSFDEQEISEALKTMRIACRAFNSTQNKLSEEQNIGIVNDMIQIASEVVSEKHSLPTYNEIFKTLALIVDSCSARAQSMLKYLDILKSNVKDQPNNSYLMNDIDQLIKRADPPKPVL